MYAVTSIPLESRIRVIFRRAEFGFFGVEVVTFKQTPFLNGDPFFVGISRDLRELYRDCIAADLLFFFALFRGFLISWLIVGIKNPYYR